MGKPGKRRRRRIDTVDFMRGVFAIGIVCYHFSCSSNSPFLLFYHYANGKWGDLMVTVFFVLSGGMLYRNYGQIGRDKLPEFYRKRFHSLYPMYYLAFLLFFIRNVAGAGRLFYGPAPWTLLLTLFGMDGYLVYAIPNYYIVGEWFFGAIVLMYLCYPLLVWGLKNHPGATVPLVAGLYGITLLVPFGKMIPFRNPFSCLLSFFFGIFLFRYPKLLRSKGVFLFSEILLLILLFLPLPLPETILAHLSGFSAFLVLFRIGVVLTKNDRIRGASRWLGNLSYPMYLVQHVLVVWLLNKYNPTNPLLYLLMMVFAVLVTILGAMLLVLLTGVGRAFMTAVARAATRGGPRRRRR